MTTIVEFKRKAATEIIGPFTVDRDVLVEAIEELALKKAFADLGIEGLSKTDKLLLALLESHTR